MNTSRVFMLASDHRWQWQEWCASHAVEASRISEVKRLVFEAFLQAREQSDDVRRHGALLLDNQYAADAIAEAIRLGIPVGAPVEKAGVFPLAWEREPFHALSRGASFVKVLVRYRPEWPEAQREDQWAKLLELQAWCRTEQIPLLVEIIIMKAVEEERDFEYRGRPAMLAQLIRDAYTRGLVPAIWKIEGTASREGAVAIDAAIREKAEPKQLILGKGAGTDAIASWFDAAAGLSSTAGFAIGRSVFMEPGSDFLLGRLTADAARDAIAQRYLGFVNGWTSREKAQG
jgi:5-dehydro-2-deoxygluconokinase